MPLEHVKTLLSVCDRKTDLGTMEYALILALLHIGMRASEIIALNMGDVNLTMAVW